MAHRNQECRVYVGNLPPDIRERELDDLFCKYGRIRDIALKGGRTGAPFAFIEFDDPRDADDAIYGRDGYDFAGGRLRVERPRGGRGGPRDGGSRFTGRHSEFRVTVTGIPSGGSWQDLKDWCRDGGLSNVVFTDVRGGEGVVEFTCESDVDKAIKNLDDTKFKSHTGESGYVRVYREGGSSRGDDRRSRDRDDRRDDRRSRSPRSRSPRSRSRSPRSRSRSPRSRSRSGSRGRSGSPRGRSGSPRGRSGSPRGRSPSPRRRSGSRGRSPSPRDDRRDD